MLEFEIPVATKSESNMREHWAPKAKRAKLQRSTAAMFSRQWTERLPPKPWLITLTRFGVRRLDTGNLSGSLKHAQDGLCDAIGIDDGDEAHYWRYRQEKRLKRDGDPGVGVRIETIGTEAALPRSLEAQVEGNEDV